MLKRARELKIAPGILPPGELNAITDVSPVKVGHFTLIEGEDIRTGATAILPHPGNLYKDKVPAGIAVGNGFGKLTGSTQIVELGEIESTIVLTNTMAVPQAAQAVIDWTLNQKGNQKVETVNPVVGETNDGRLNNIRRQALTPEMIRKAIDNADGGPVIEGSIGAGTGTVALGWKGGIGTSSRVLPKEYGGFSVGVLVQTNFGGILQILGVRVGVELGNHYLREKIDPGEGGSIMIIVATDAPFSDRNLTRLARRAFAGLARTGSSMRNGSGDYAIAFSTSQEVRRTIKRRKEIHTITEMPNELTSPYFQAVIEAAEEAIYNSLFMADSITGFKRKRIEALPVDQVTALMKEYGRIE